MSLDDVLGVLGEPLQRTVYSQDDLEVLRYSFSPSDGSYRVRVVQFRNGKVVGTISEFYVD